MQSDHNRSMTRCIPSIDRELHDLTARKGMFYINFEDESVQVVRCDNKLMISRYQHDDVISWLTDTSSSLESRLSQSEWGELLPRYNCNYLVILDM